MEPKEPQSWGQRLRAGLRAGARRIAAWVRQKWARYQLTRWLIVGGLTIILGFSIYLTIVAKTAGVKNLKARLEQTTMIYDRDHQAAGSLYAQKGTYVPLTRISKAVPAAVLSTEDRNFYHEHGFSVTGLARASLLLVKNKLLHRNYISGGGSTLTQQLVKNAFLTQQQTFSRKAREIFIAVEVENQYSKADILTMYLNNAYFGHGVWGVQDAAKRYFDTDARDLTVPQAATLAGMLTSPGIYDPVTHPAATKARRNLVLDLMVQNHQLSAAAAARAKRTPLTVANGYTGNDSYKYPYFFDAVIAEAINHYGLSEKEVMNNGYKIYTTLDQGQQKALQTTFSNANNFPMANPDGSTVQAASIAMDPKTGGVNAVVGGRGPHVFRGYNRATQMRRQPGSTIKPIAVYAPALEHGYAYDSMLVDKEQSYGNNHYTPRNYDHTYAGSVPMYKALYESLNAPAVWLLDKIGVDAGYRMVEQFGLPVEKGDRNLALALGGMTRGVSPEQMARAYAVFAARGQLPTSHYITKIVDASGKVVKRDDQTKTQRVLKPKTTDTMTSMMLGVFKHGTGKAAAPAGYELAGKTGTTNSGLKGDDNDRDKWIIGYTPDVVVATWEGYDETSKTNQLYDVENHDIYGLYKTEMTSLLPQTAGTKFKVKDAQELAEQRTGQGKGGFWQRAGKLANQVGARLDQAWNALQSLF